MIKSSIFMIVLAMIIYGYFTFIYGRLEYKGSERLDGKTVLITGANTGIGKEAAIDLARRGARVICACRSKSRGKAAVEDIKKTSGSNNVVLMMLDLGSLKSVRQFAKDIYAKEERLDVLINNAGLVGPVYRDTTKDGFERMIGVNHLGHFLLTDLLLDLLKKSQPSRIVVVSSGSHTMVPGMNFDDLMSEKSYSVLTTYAYSKLANVLFSFEMSRRLKGTSVTINSLHPGVVMTEVFRYFEDYLQLPSFINKALRWMLSAVLRDARQGAQTVICLAVDKSLQSVSGQYFEECEIYETSEAATNETEAKMLWDISQKLVNLSP
ncbi:Retinol dehydrogenase 11 [Trichoplax sp. H2]|nr:Retinol dehydrogenase 11 [Trichoplax sp. H2]|eukprot:RDD40723.1 Retinol dehydrogenase 11 [Trichoplax sp. H2]